MKSPDANAIADNVRYRPFTEKFRERYPDEYRKLNDRILDLQKNYRMYGHLCGAGKYDQATRVKDCGRRMVGNDPKNLQNEVYCRNPYWCRHCSRVLASNATRQWYQACLAFSEQCRRGELIYHSLLIKADLYGQFGTPEDDLQAALDLLVGFQQPLRDFATNHRCHRLAERARPANAIGPVIGTIHVTPEDIKWHRPTAHMHLMIVTTRDASKKKITQRVTDMWRKHTVDSKIRYRPSQPEVTRFRPPRAKPGDHESLIATETRLGHFWPEIEDDRTTLQAMSASTYLSLRIKDHWDPENLLRVRELVRGAGYKPGQMYQRLGMMGVKLAQLPHQFSGDALAHKYRAEFNGDRWVVGLRAEGRPSAKPTAGK